MSRPRPVVVARLEGWARRLTPITVLRALLVLVFAASAIWLTVAVGAASLLRFSQPDIALRFLPVDARARTAAAEVMLSEPSRMAEAKALALGALRRDPTVVAAWRTLGIVAAASGRNAEAAAHFRTAERMSRRDSATQLWLIEERVRNDDVVGALRHYDIALRSSTSVQAVLIPVLLSATAEPALTEPLGDILAREPDWSAAYYRPLLRPPANGAGATALVEQIRLRNPEADLRELQALPTLLAEKGAYGEAVRAYRVLARPGPTERILRNGGFERTNLFPLLEWDLASTSNLRAEPGPVDGAIGVAALRIYAEFGASGVVARQLLMLEPGRYRLRSVRGSEAERIPDRLVWRVACAGADGIVLLEQDVLPREPGRRTVQAAFHVSGDCPAQWLSLEAAAVDAPGGAEAWVDSVTVEPLSG
jgi:tetratricopeptide (TPR) repeat protein